MSAKRKVSMPPALGAGYGQINTTNPQQLGCVFCKTVEVEGVLFPRSQRFVVTMCGKRSRAMFGYGAHAWLQSQSAVALEPGGMVNPGICIDTLQVEITHHPEDECVTFREVRPEGVTPRWADVFLTPFEDEEDSVFYTRLVWEVKTWRDAGYTLIDATTHDFLDSISPDSL